MISENRTQHDTRDTIKCLIAVYGSLKEGYWNHDRFCSGALHIEKATIRGRLYELPSRIPVLRVPDGDILSVGTSNPVADAAIQQSFEGRVTMATGCNESLWDMIHGEVIVLPDPRLSLPPIDRLEGFRPGLPSLYRRVLVPVLKNGDEWTAAWCYVGDDALCRSLSATGKTCWP